MANRNPTDMGGAFAGVPMCSRDRCASYDGKRCRETGNEPGEVCVPEVRAIATARRDAENHTVEAVATWLEAPCPCGYADCESKYRELAAGVRGGAWRTS